MQVDPFVGLLLWQGLCIVLFGNRFPVPDLVLCEPDMDLARVGIVDPHPIFRIGLAKVFAGEADTEVVGSGASAQDAIDIVLTCQPDILFLEVNMPGGGIRAAQEIQRTGAATRFMFLTCSERQEDVTAALQTGACGYMLKGITPEILLQTVRLVLAGETYIMPQLATRLLVSASQKQAASAGVEGLDSLTARERQILSELTEGQTNKEIARKLNLAEKTVKHYMGRVMHKLCVRNRTEAVLVSQSVRHAMVA
jgi:two-component system, NarL family, nitrate/nitrite response regulator NarL